MMTLEFKMTQQGYTSLVVTDSEGNVLEVVPGGEGYFEVILNQNVMGGLGTYDSDWTEEDEAAGYCTVEHPCPVRRSEGHGACVHTA